MAEEFVDAASRLDVSTLPPPTVVYFLCGHALELAYKSVLIVRGTTDRALRKLGHDLRACVQAAVSLVNDNAVAPSDELVGVLELLAPFYSAKALEYIEPGFRRLPLPADTVRITSTSVRSIRNWVEPEVRRALRSGQA